MSDLIEQLRAMAKYKHSDVTVAEDAANEIERLRQYVTDLEHDINLQNIQLGELQTKLDKAKAALDSLPESSKNIKEPI